MTKPEWAQLLDERIPDHNRLAVVEVGSTAHGTALAGQDDFDVTVVWLESLRQVFHTQQVKQRKMVRTQPEGHRSGPGDVDANVFTFRAWMALAVKGNPSVLQTIWCPILEERNGFWSDLRTMGDAFVGRHLVGPHLGYMNNQIGRITGERGGGHGKRGSGGREELIEAHGYDTKFAMHAARLGFQCYELLYQRELELPMTGEPGEWLRAVRRGEIPKSEWLARTRDIESRVLAAADRMPPSLQGPDLKRLADFSARVHILGARTWTR